MIKQLIEPVENYSHWCQLHRLTNKLAYTCGGDFAETKSKLAKAIQKNKSELGEATLYARKDEDFIENTPKFNQRTKDQINCIKKINQTAKSILNYGTC